MARCFACPFCATEIVTGMRIGETATCDDCGEEAVVPEHAWETNRQPPATEQGPPAAPAPPPARDPALDLPDRAPDLAERRPRPAGFRVSLAGYLVLGLAVVMFLGAMTVEDMRNTAGEVIWFFWTPFVLLSGVALIAAGQIVRALDGIREEMRKVGKRPGD
jgi:hypothetical protein